MRDVFACPPFMCGVIIGILDISTMICWLLQYSLTCERSDRQFSHKVGFDNRLMVVFHFKKSGWNVRKNNPQKEVLAGDSEGDVCLYSIVLKNYKYKTLWTRIKQTLEGVLFVKQNLLFAFKINRFMNNYLRFSPGSNQTMKMKKTIFLSVQKLKSMFQMIV